MGKPKSGKLYFDFLKYRKPYNKLKSIARQNYCSAELSKRDMGEDMEIIKHNNWKTA